MSRPSQSYQFGLQGAIVVVLLVSAVLWVPYVHVLGLGFTGADTFALIRSGRIDGLEDVGRLVFQPLLSETSFAIEAGSFYRPLTSASYALDAYLWGASPAYSHFVDLVLRWLSGLLLMAVIWSFTKDRFATILGLLLFALHPLNESVVPVVERRADLLATTLQLATMFSFASGRLKLSFVWFVAAVLAKEGSIVLVGVLFAISFFRDLMWDPPKTFLRAAVSAFLAVLPFLLFVVPYLLWRIWALGDLGGYHFERTFGQIIDLAPRNAANYLGALLDGPAGKGQWLPILGVAGILVTVAAYPIWRKDLSHHSEMLMSMLIFGCATIAPIPLYLIGGVVAEWYPFASLAAFCALFGTTGSILIRSLWKARPSAAQLPALFAGFAVLVNLVSLVLHTPRFFADRDWLGYDRMSRELETLLDENIDSIASAQFLRLENWPESLVVDQYKNWKGAWFIEPWSVEGYLELQRPDQSFVVTVEGPKRNIDADNVIGPYFEAYEGANGEYIISFVGQFR